VSYTDFNISINMIGNIMLDTSINMTGILVGDLDGSYVA